MQSFSHRKKTHLQKQWNEFSNTLVNTFIIGGNDMPQVNNTNKSAARPEQQPVQTQPQNPIGYLVKNAVFPVLSEMFYQSTGLTSMPYVGKALAPVSTFENKATTWLNSWGAEAKKSTRNKEDAAPASNQETTTQAAPASTQETTTQAPPTNTANTTEATATSWFSMPNLNCGCCDGVKGYFQANQARFSTAAALGVTHALLSRIAADNWPKTSVKRRTFFTAAATMAIVGTGSYFAGSSLNPFEVADMATKIVISRHSWEHATRPALQWGTKKSQLIYSKCAEGFNGALEYTNWNLTYDIKPYGTKND